MEELLRTNIPDLPMPLSREHNEIEQEVSKFLESAENRQPSDKEPEISIHEIHRIIRNLKPGKSPGIDGFPGIVFKRAIDILGDKLRAIFNILLRSGAFPEDWAKAKIIFIKKPNKQKRTLEPTAPSHCCQ